MREWHVSLKGVLLLVGVLMNKKVGYAIYHGGHDGKFKQPRACYWPPALQ